MTFPSHPFLHYQDSLTSPTPTSIFRVSLLLKGESILVFFILSLVTLTSELLGVSGPGKGHSSCLGIEGKWSDNGLMRQHFCFSLSFSIKTGVPRWSHTRYWVTCQSSCLRVSYIFYVAAKNGLLTTKSYRTPFHLRAWFFVSLSLPILTDRYMIPWVYTDERGNRLFGTLYH